MRYACGMGEVASRELRNDTRGLLRRVEQGEEVTITVDGRPVALLVPLRARPRSISSTELFRRLSEASADAGLAAELRELVPGTTDDLPFM